MTHEGNQESVRQACYRAGLCGCQEIAGGNMELFEPSIVHVLIALKIQGHENADIGGFTRDLLNSGLTLRDSLSAWNEQTVTLLASLLSRNSVKID